jgi:MFS family permease
MQPSAATHRGNWVNNSPGYQALLVLLLSLNFGIVFFDRQALNVLMPFVQPELDLTQTQIGLIAGGLSFTWAIAAFGIGKLSDTLGRRKMLLIAATLAFSLCSFLTGLASSFALLIGARLLMGAAEGGVMPISHAMVASEVDPKRRGLAQGVAQNLGSNLLGSFAAPVLLITFATAFGWRESFYLAGVPGIISAVLMWFLLREPAPLPPPPRPRRA